MKLMEKVILFATLQCLIHIAYPQDWHFEGQNVAKNKIALQNPGNVWGPASRAVDGNTNSTWTQGSCSHTKNDYYGQAYWKVLLDGHFIVKGVKIFNRDKFQERLEDFQVFGGQPETMLYDDGAANQKLYMESVIPIKINSTTPFSEIKIFLPERSNNYSILTLCEVEVFAVTNGCIGIEEGVLKWHIREGTGRFNSTYGLISENSVLYFTCNDPGYRLSHTADITCLPNGNYSASLPACNGENIKSQEQEQSSSILPGVIGGSVAGVSFLTFAVVFAVYFLLHKRRRDDSKHVATNDEFDNVAKKSPPDSCYENTMPFICNDDKLETPKEKAVNDQYYNCNEIQRIPSSAIQLSDLPDIVLSMDSYKDKLAQQFKSLPYGLKRPCNSALEAKGKNRYRNMYAYDDTRVVLDVWNKEQETDYINASFVHGYHRPKAYIATQEPTHHIISDFWRMIWQMKSDKIIMLTDSKQNGKMICENYWPDHDSMTYGMITVTMARSETFSNFVIRTFHLSKDDEERRTVTHFHFTSWLYIDGPLFCSSLVHFHHKVKDEIKPNEAPMIVHCSAGIGRTGTFIALDYLYDQANELGYIDVLGCVESLRQQRVNMVQTKNQYVFVHIALAEIFSLKTSCVPTAAFEDHYKHMLNKNKEKEDRNIEFEFELLEKLSMSCEDDKSLEQKANESKVEDFMPSLSQQGLHLFGEYIDAAFLPIYRKENALIIARSPSERTVEDFWKLIYHQSVHTIVMMEDKPVLYDNKPYWPSTEKDIKIGEVTIASKNTYKKKGHTLVSLKAAKDNKEINVLLIQFGGWNANKCTPDNSETLLSALELVEENQRKTGISPVLVHCMDGVERSGLFCVITSVLDRLKLERNVAISQVIQEMRSRRPNVIPNVDQFQFCHDVVLTYLQRNEAYANFNLR